MTLSDLPTFRIDTIEILEEAWLLRGALSHRATVRNGRSWLYRAPDTFLVGDLERASALSLFGEFRTPIQDYEPSLLTGQDFVWTDGYWNASFILSIVDANHRWHRIEFKNTDAFQKYAKGIRVWRNAEGEVRGPDETILAGGWDHEHCTLCNGHIRNGNVAYKDLNNDWLCSPCYERYGATHDIGFLAEE